MNVDLRRSTRTLISGAFPMSRTGTAPTLSGSNFPILRHVPLFRMALQNSGVFVRTVPLSNIRIPQDESSPVQDRAQIVGTQCSVWFKLNTENWRRLGPVMRFKVIRVARNAGETQLLLEKLDQTRAWFSIHDLSQIKIWHEDFDVRGDQDPK